MIHIMHYSSGYVATVHVTYCALSNVTTFNIDCFPLTWHCGYPCNNNNNNNKFAAYVKCTLSVWICKKKIERRVAASTCLERLRITA